MNIGATTKDCAHILFTVPMYYFQLKYLLCLVALLQLNSAYKPVVLIHGFLGRATHFRVLENTIQKAHPGTKVISINLFPHIYSMNRMWFQVQKIKNYVQKIAHSSPDGIHIIGFSQGGIIARGIIESWDDHNVDTFISVAAPHMGMYGGSVIRKIPLLGNIIISYAYKFLYNRNGQIFSFGGYWKDPFHMDKYRKTSQYLPYLNNEITHKNSQAYKNNFLKLKKLVLIGGPNDGAFHPWQSSLFGFYKEKSTDIKHMRQQWVYEQDTFGLKTLDQRAAVHVIPVPNVEHMGFLENQNVIQNHILPFLT